MSVGKLQRNPDTGKLRRTPAGRLGRNTSASTNCCLCGPECVCCSTLTVTIFGGDFEPEAFGTYTLTINPFACTNLFTSLLYSGTGGAVKVNINFDGGRIVVSATNLGATVFYGNAGIDIECSESDDPACCPDALNWTGKGVTVECE